MYKMYYDFDLVTEYLECYLIDSSLQLSDSLELPFKHITRDELTNIKLYKQCDSSYSHTIYYVNIVNLQLFDYKDFLQVYDIVKTGLWPFGIHKEVQEDLDLILLNWSVI